MPEFTSESIAQKSEEDANACDTETSAGQGPIGSNSGAKPATPTLDDDDEDDLGDTSASLVSQPDAGEERTGNSIVNRDYYSTDSDPEESTADQNDKPIGEHHLVAQDQGHSSNRHRQQQRTRDKSTRDNVNSSSSSVVVKSTAKSGWDSSDSDFEVDDRLNKREKSGQPIDLLLPDDACEGDEKCLDSQKPYSNRSSRRPSDHKSPVLKTAVTKRPRSSSAQSLSRGGKGGSPTRRKKRNDRRYSTSSSTLSSRTSSSSRDRYSSSEGEDEAVHRNSRRRRKRSLSSASSCSPSRRRRRHRRRRTKSSSVSSYYSRSRSRSRSRSHRYRRTRRPSSYHRTRHYRRRSYSSSYSRSPSWQRRPVRSRSRSLSLNRRRRSSSLGRPNSSRLHHRSRSPISDRSKTIDHTSSSMVADLANKSVVAAFNRVVTRPPAKPKLSLNRQGSKQEEGKKPLNDIPLPHEANQQHDSSDTDNGTPSQAATGSPPSYIGPQVSPSLARRLGLTLNGKDSSPASSTPASCSPSIPANSSSSNGTSTVTTTTASDFVISPDDHQYKALQEQARMHARLNSNAVAAGQSSTSFDYGQLTSNAAMLVQQQQLLNQQHHLATAKLSTTSDLFSSSAALATRPTVVLPSVQQPYLAAETFRQQSDAHRLSQLMASSSANHQSVAGIDLQSLLLAVANNQQPQQQAIQQQQQMAALILHQQQQAQLMAAAGGGPMQQSAMMAQQQMNAAALLTAAARHQQPLASALQQQVSTGNANLLALLQQQHQQQRQVVRPVAGLNPVLMAMAANQQQQSMALNAAARLQSANQLAALQANLAVQRLPGASPLLTSDKIASLLIASMNAAQAEASSSSTPTNTISGTRLPGLVNQQNQSTIQQQQILALARMQQLDQSAGSAVATAQLQQQAAIQHLNRIASLQRSQQSQLVNMPSSSSLLAAATQQATASGQPPPSNQLPK